MFIRRKKYFAYISSQLSSSSYSRPIVAKEITHIKYMVFLIAKFTSPGISIIGPK